MRALVVLALAMLIVLPAAAQQVDITKPAPPATREREPGVIAPGLSRETRPLDADNYPRGGRVPYEPGFIRGLSSKTATGRIGIAGWTAPSVPVGGEASGWYEHNGWFALGFSVTWDGPPPSAPARPAP
jgi:hypothetical protein